MPASFSVRTDARSFSRSVVPAVATPSPTSTTRLAPRFCASPRAHPMARSRFDAPSRRDFYRARNAIYHLFRVLRSDIGPLTVLAPDYNSGNEVLAMHAAGATIRYCPIGRDLRLDPAEVERQCERHAPDVLYVIHYAGKVHYDGAKAEETVIQVWGMGPATSTPAEKR